MVKVVMRILRPGSYIVVFALIGLVYLFLSSHRVSAQLTSPNYKVEETQFGIGGDLDSASTSYKAQLSAGANAAGFVSSSSFWANGGYLTARQEYLEMMVNVATIDLGTLSTASTATGTATFYVRAYSSSGYTVQTVTPPPTNGTAQLAPMTVAGSPVIGTEQFGINLVANTSPIAFGANPAPVPDSTFAYGAAATGYGTTNQFKYNAGDIIATAPKGVGRTNYTISYIANMAPLTRGGLYTVDQVLVVVASY